MDEKRIQELRSRKSKAGQLVKQAEARLSEIPQKIKTFEIRLAEVAADCVQAGDLSRARQLLAQIRALEDEKRIQAAALPGLKQRYKDAKLNCARIPDPRPQQTREARALLDDFQERVHRGDASQADLDRELAGLLEAAGVLHERERFISYLRAERFQIEKEKEHA